MSDHTPHDSDIEAATEDENQRVEKWTRKAARIMARSACDELGQPYEVFDMLIERLIPRGRALVNAGWTPPENDRNVERKPPPSGVGSSETLTD